MVAYGKIIGDYKHDENLSEYRNYCNTGFTAGYRNTTSAVNAVQFKYASGNIDAGSIKLYGIKDS